MTEATGWTEAANFAAMFEAEMAAARLIGAGIPAQVRGERGMFGAGYAGGVPHGASVWVPADLLLDARELLDVDDADED
ncbi:MAG: putative signal transducing protein [Longimicrobiales bacterium]